LANTKLFFTLVPESMNVQLLSRERRALLNDLISRLPQFDAGSWYRDYTVRRNGGYWFARQIICDNFAYPRSLRVCRCSQKTFSVKTHR
jgi:hypothetical protein